MRTTFLTGLLVLLPVPHASAEAGSVAYTADRTALVVTLTGAAETLRLEQDGTDILVSGQLAENDEACTVEETRVRCATTGVTRVYVRLGGGDDRLVSSHPLRLLVEAGPGNDMVEGSPANDWVLGGDGHDRLYGHGGNDLLDGQAGNDLLVGGAGSDDMQGRAGRDTVSYAYMTRGATLVSGCACSGDWEGGERDVIRPEVEVYQGTAYPDYVRGGAGPELLAAGGGNDLVYGEGGDDVIPVDGGDWVFGGSGFDTATYAGLETGVVAWLDEKANDAPGNANIRADVESLVGSRFHDVLLGNGRANVLRGGGGDDDLVGFAGDDVLVGDGGADSYSPGPGHDRCVADRLDLNPGDCETPS